MPRIICVSIAVAIWPCVTMGQQQCAAPNYTPAQCAAPAPAPPTPAPPQPAMARNFLRGPGTGQTAGEANSLGLRGFTIHVPEMRLALPTIELPSLIRYRREAEMLFDNTRGALVAAEVQDFGNLPSAAPATAPPMPAPPQGCTPFAAPACAAPPLCTQARAPQESMQQRLARLEQLERELAALRQECVNDLTRQPARQPQDGLQGQQATNAPNRSSMTTTQPRIIQTGSDDSAVKRGAFVIPAQHDDDLLRRVEPFTGGGLSEPQTTEVKKEEAVAANTKSKWRLRK